MTENPKSIIFGCSSTQLTDTEREFFERTQPLGFILFLRNCQTPEQVSHLVADLKSCVNHDYVPILIDQEGGKISRLKSPNWRQYPEPSLFGQIAENDLGLACWAVEMNAFLIGLELNRLGINVNCAPLLDLHYNGAHHIIGSRAFHDSPEIVSTLGYYSIKGFHRAGTVPVIKHLPGHGRATSDSHEELPIVRDSLSDLQETDFAVFKSLCEQIKEEEWPTPWGMTAHILYRSLDSDLPATLSETVIDKIIRRHIEFKGFLISDCITMKALQGEMGELSQSIIEAGCDAVLHCSGVLEEMIKVASKTPPLSNKSMERLKRGMVSRHTYSPENEDSLWIDLNYQLKPYWNNKRRIM